MKLLSVNVSLPKEFTFQGRTTTTGIFKEPVSGRVMLRTLSLDGDGQADLKNHGGIDKAAYAYSIENYDYWERELGRTDFTFGQFGENFTVEGMLDDEFPKMFLTSGRPGFYLRVVEEGEVGAGDVLDRVKTDPERMTVQDVCHLLYFDQKNLEGAKKALRIQALSPGWRGSFEERLTKAGVPIEYGEEPREGEKCCGP